LSKVGTGAVKNSYGSATLCVTVLPKIAMEAHGMLRKNLNQFFMLRRRSATETTIVQSRIWSRDHISGLTSSETGSEQKVPYVLDKEHWKAVNFAEINVFLPDHLQR
jgi:hypothetical protein